MNVARLPIPSFECSAAGVARRTNTASYGDDYDREDEDGACSIMTQPRSPSPNRDREFDDNDWSTSINSSGIAGNEARRLATNSVKEAATSSNITNNTNITNNKRKHIASSKESNPANTATRRGKRQTKRRANGGRRVEPQASGASTPTEDDHDSSQPSTSSPSLLLFPYNGEMKTLDEILQVKEWSVQKLVNRQKLPGQSAYYYLCKWQDTWETQGMYFALKQKGFGVKVLQTKMARDGETLLYKCQWKSLWEPEDFCSRGAIQAFEHERAEKRAKRHCCV